jgi:hypothetical protein
MRRPSRINNGASLQGRQYASQNVKATDLREQAADLQLQYEAMSNPPPST